MSESIEYLPVGSRGAYALDVRSSDRLWHYFHERYCITLVNDGLARWRYRNRDAEAPPSGIMLMEPGEIHVNTKIEQAGSFFALFLSPEHLADLAGCDSLPHFRLELLRGADCAAQLLKLVESCRGDDVAAQEEQLCLAVSAVLSQAAEHLPRLPGRARTRVRKGARLMEDRYNGTPWKTVDVRDVASELGMSYHWFVHSFRDEFGIPPYRYVQSLRRSRARALFATGPHENVQSARDVAVAVGYADAPHMSRDWKKTFGVSPAAMARAMHDGWVGPRTNPPRVP